MILIGCAYYSTQVMMNNSTAKPLKVFQEAYLNDPADVRILSFGGAGGGYFDIWLVFKALRPIELRQANKFKSEYCEAARSWFLNKFPDDPDLKRSQDMKLMSCHEHSSVTEIINRWSLSNEKTGKYYFRIWGIK